MEIHNIIIVIPSYEPRFKLCEIVNELKDIGFNSIIVVNDGSSLDYDVVFNEIESKCKIIKHLENKGKGEALKSAFDYIIKSNELKNYNGVITMDCDGQHSVKDVEKIAQAIQKENQVVLGCRNFDNNNVPLKSKLGNKITSFLMKLSGLHLEDTQTGLRAIPLCNLDELIQVKGSKFDYEMNMLLYFSKNKIPIIQISIETLYYNENKGTHYKPIADSILIFKSILSSEFSKYIIAAVVSFFVDLSLFNILIIAMKGKHSYYILLANFIARAISLILNFTLNKYYVFENKNGWNKQFFKYLLLCMFTITISSFLIQIISTIFCLNEVVVKILVDSLLFMMNYIIQRKRVFL